MANKPKHVLGISGGKDSSALAIYLNDKYPQLDITYYFCDTGKELDETYKLVENLEAYLGKPIQRLSSLEDDDKAPFDHYLDVYGGFLPSQTMRWCTRKLKLEPFENQLVKDDPTISYVGIRGDEDREGYISKKPNIQSIFPFRKNIWSQDVIKLVLNNDNIPRIKEITQALLNNKELDNFIEILEQPLSPKYKQTRKLNELLTLGIAEFNRIVFEFLKDSDLPLALEDNFPLIENEDVLNVDDIFNILRESGVGVPEYYNKVEFEVDGKKGEYARSRSGCFFCFYQQKIEWVWLYENHPARFWKAVEYEKDGYTWINDEKLTDLIKPERIKQIKREQINKNERSARNQDSELLLDTILEAEGEGCSACFV